MKRLRPSLVLTFAGVNAACLAIALLLGWMSVGKQLSNNVYDMLFSHVKAPHDPPQSVVLAIDEQTLTELGGQPKLRPIFTLALRTLAAAHPAVTAIDLIFADPTDPQDDQNLADAMQSVGKLVLAADIVPDQKQWEMPLKTFPRTATGHVHAEPDSQDGISREYPLERAAGNLRLWALGLEAFRLSRNQSILESPDELQIGDMEIPSRWEDGRTILIRFRPDIPKVSLAELLRDPSKQILLKGKAVFLGITARTLSRDRLLTPYANGEPVAGVEIHAQAFETLASGNLLLPARLSTTLLLCLITAIVITLPFLWLRGWQAYAIVVAALFTAHWIPLWALQNDVAIPAFPVLATAWLCALASGSLEYFGVTRQLSKSETEKSRYQQAIQFVTHEMRTPLTAIQGSSELMGRYNLTEQKQKQMAQMINAESKRLARMITTFLSVERLNDGQLELKVETASAADLVSICVERARPLADRKQIRIECQAEDGALSIDRELMEYAVYNLVTNAIKYSPPETVIHIGTAIADGKVRLSVQDQGMGMDAKELRNIFQKFYRTKKAEQSGEAGTGIGLSIVEQIVRRHSGKIEVSSIPGAGSCFTLVLPEAP